MCSSPWKNGMPCVMYFARSVIEMEIEVLGTIRLFADIAEKLETNREVFVRWVSRAERGVRVVKLTRTS